MNNKKNNVNVLTFDYSVWKILDIDCFFDELDKDAVFYLHYADLIYTLTFSFTINTWTNTI